MPRPLRKETIYEVVQFNPMAGTPDRWFVHPLDSDNIFYNEEAAKQVARSLNIAKMADKLKRELTQAELTIANLQTLLKGE